jgi:hypothetical protein
MSHAAKDSAFYSFFQTLIGGATLLGLAFTVIFAAKAAKAAIDTAKHGSTAALATVRAASAAEKSAEIPRLIERAFVFVYPEFEAAVTTLLGKEKPKTIRKITAGFMFQNYGRTRATIKSDIFNFCLVKPEDGVPGGGNKLNGFEFILPSGGVYPIERDRNADVIKPPEKYEQIIERSPNICVIEIDRSQSAQMIDGSLLPITLVQVIYEDIFEDTYEVRNCCVYDAKSGTFDRYGGTEYNYLKKISPPNPGLVAVAT